MSISTGNMPKALMAATPNRPANALARITAPATPIGGSQALAGLQPSAGMAMLGASAFHPGEGAAFQKRIG